MTAAGRSEDGFLLHACCGPCAIYPVQALLEEGIRPVLYYANPNIQPALEWHRRLEALRTVADRFRLALVVEDLDTADHWQRLAGDRERRCRLCYALRLNKAATYAASEGFSAFSSSLLVSPYQDREEILRLGRLLAARLGPAFCEADWRPGYRQGQEEARALALYRQRYCGCLPSLDESRFSRQIRQEQAALQAEKPG